MLARILAYFIIVKFEREFLFTNYNEKVLLKINKISLTRKNFHACEKKFNSVADTMKISISK
jgi:hypothetical protein